MNRMIGSTSLLVLAMLATDALSQTTGRARADVKQETAAAIRSGDVLAPGDSGITRRERQPAAYAPRKAKKPPATASAKTESTADAASTRP